MIFRVSLKMVSWFHLLLLLSLIINSCRECPWLPYWPQYFYILPKQYFWIASPMQSLCILGTLGFFGLVGYFTFVLVPEKFIVYICVEKNAIFFQDLRFEHNCIINGRNFNERNSYISIFCILFRDLIAQFLLVHAMNILKCNFHKAPLQSIELIYWNVSELGS